LELAFFKPEDRERSMMKIEEIRKKQMYYHECHSGCKERG